MSCSPVSPVSACAAFSASTLPPTAFGALKWEQYCGIKVVEPRLPPDIDKILASPCPIFSGCTVADTHFLFLIPEGITLESLEHLTQHAKQGNKVGFGYKIMEEWGKHKDTPNKSTHWVLLTKNVIPGSVKETWKRQKALAKNYTAQGYEISSAIEVAACLLLEHVQTGKRVWEDPVTFARCPGEYEELMESMPGWISWPVCIGGFTPGMMPGGLSVQVFYDTFLTPGHAGWGSPCTGITLARRFS